MENANERAWEKQVAQKLTEAEKKKLDRQITEHVEEPMPVLEKRQKVPVK